jgi:hypothetical protein
MARTTSKYGAKNNGPGHPVKRPNNIKGPILSPDSKEEKARQHEREVLNASLLVPGVSVSYVRKTVDHGNDGFVEPLRKALELKDRDVVFSIGLVYCGALNDGNDVASKNSGTNYIRRTFVQAKPDCDIPGLPVEERLETVQKICDVSIEYL